MAIDVTVTNQCDRCKRKENVVISSDKIAEYEARQEAAEANKARVLEFVEANKDQLPDLVVIFKGDVQMLSEVCDAHCANPVRSGVKTMFREHKPRQPRQAKPQTEDKPNEAQTAGKNGKSSSKKKGAKGAAAPAG